MWSERVIQKFKIPYRRVERIGKVYLYLMNEDDEILSYHTFLASDFLEEKPAWDYYEMTPDPSVGKIP